MSLSELDNLTRAEQLFNKGKLDKALEILNVSVQFEGFTSQQKDYFQLLKGLILFYQWKSDELIEFGEQIFQEGQISHNNLQSVDGLFFIITGLIAAEKFEEASRKLETAEVYLRLISDVSKDTFIQRKARIKILKGWINLDLNNQDLAEKYLGWVLDLQNQLGNTFETAWVNLMMARLTYQGKRRYDLAREYTNKLLSIAEKIKFNHFWIAFGQLSLGVIHSSLGEIDIGLKYYMKSLDIYREINNNFFIAMTLLNIGGNYYQLGNIELAMKYNKECLSYQEKLSLTLDFPLSNIVEVALEMGDNELAQHYFNQLKNLYNQKKEGLSEIVYLSTKAHILKKSSRIRDKAKAEKIFKKIIDIDTIWGQFAIGATVHLCDLLLSEYRFTNNNEVLDELNHYIAKLLALAEKTHSYIYFCRTFMLQAKLALINFDLKAARRLLTQAQKIAESHGLKRLAMRVSHEHDELLKQLEIWEKLKKTNASLSKRWKFAGLNEQMENMVRKKMIESTKISEEKPVSIFIITEGGSALLSHSFIDKKTFESHLFGGFLTTIDYFIKEMFSEGLDRAVFGEYTLLLKSVPPFFISYIFKGDSYYAHQKINYFIENIRKEHAIWQNILKSFQVNQTINLKEMPLLESLITETFIT
ncbi:MAG: tetratricopeptide repeat protein [Promethearchaeota archaeon]